MGTGAGPCQYRVDLGATGRVSADSTVVVEAWFRLPPHDLVLRGLERAGVDRWVEVWCHVDPEVLIARYTARTRHRGHPPAEDFVDELRHLAAVARPMALGPYVEVDTSDEFTLDLEALSRRIARLLEETADG